MDEDAFEESEEGWTEPGVNLRDVSELTIDPAKLGRKTKHVRGLVQGGALPALTDTPLLDDGAAVALTACREDGKLRVRGEITGRIGLECARCLVAFGFPVDVAVDRFYAQGDDPAGEQANLEMTEELVFLGDGPFALARLVEEELVLALPMKALCDPSCKGLCDRCGADMNQGLCACPEERGDSPFAALAALKKN